MDINAKKEDLKEVVKELVDAKVHETSLDVKAVTDKVNAFGEKIEELTAKFGETQAKLEKNFNLSGSAVDEARLKEHGRWADTVQFFITAKSLGNDGLRRKYLNTSDDSAVVPKEFAQEVFKTMDDYSEIRRDARKYTMKTRAVDLNELTAKVSVSKTSEGSNATESEPEYTARTITAEDYVGLIPMTFQFDQDNELNIIQELVDMFAEQFAKAEQTSFLNSTVSGAEGIMKVSGVTSYILGGAADSTKDAFSDFVHDDIVKGVAKFKNTVSKSALANAKFYANPDIFGNLALLKDDNGVPLVPGYLTGGLEPRVYGKQIVELTELPANSASAVTTKFAFIADLKKSFLIGDYANIEVKILEEASLSGINLGRAGGRALRMIKRTAQKVIPASNILVFLTSTT